MGRPFRDVLTSALAALFVGGCASTEEVRPPEGQAVFQAGAVPVAPSAAQIVPGPEIRHPALLVPALDPTWNAAWTGGDRTKPGGQSGGLAGFVTGLAIVQSVPVFLLVWPAAVGIVAGTTAVGALGGQVDSGTFAAMDARDRQALLEAATTLRPDRLLRESAARVLATRMGRPPLSLSWYPTWGPDTPGTDVLAGARGQGADGVLDLAVEAFGLAVGDEAETVGVFVRLRARLVEAAGGGLRYERILEHGPGRPLAGLPRPAVHTVDLMAFDQARLFRHEVQEVIVRLAGLLAEDPALPLGRP
ncbi:MAG: hypothetical protein A3G35_00465 [candidate division NC10 bacterium RIFCSPLOWO2_12_FULL_66_18]|nr:MAG: hypothetical protein A3H39_15275 [candidate division NC10 bacterium RIFCSPLOWO2_02_FULL_66_22]OGB96939.1 MAG: hypothetical protein A3G35_00465 [candidate division NC10 bacterium RIFCSPLOWO2_12_FULL_66_18]